MSVSEVLQSLGSWSVQLRDDTPDEILKKLDVFGHIVILRGKVDPDQTAGATLLSKARYVGVLIDYSNHGRTISGDSLIRWLGDEDKKGAWLSSKVALTNGSLTAWLTALLPVSIGLGSIHDPGGSLTTEYQYVTRREAIESVCDAFNVSFRINGNATLDAGTQAQLYSATPDTIIAAKSSLGADLDLTALGGEFQTEKTGRDYSTGVFLLGSTQDDGTVVNASAFAPSVPYLDLRGNQVSIIRPISESGETSGTATARAQLQLNRFNRLVSSVRVTAQDYEWRGSFVVGDNAYVYDPDNLIFDLAKEVFFRGEILHPAVIQITAHTWQITDAFTVLFRTKTGEYVDLTRYVDFESGSDEVTIGDVPKSLTSTGNPVLDRSQSAPDQSVPNPPTSLGLVTNSVISAKGQNIASVTASWTAPTQNTDGSVLTDLSHYLVHWRPQFRAPQWNSILSQSTTAEIPNLTVGLIYDVEVAAVDLVGGPGHTSTFTSVASITAAPDTTGPNPPADPVVGSYLGQLRIEYAGTDSSGNPMASDTNYVDVHVSATNGFTPSLATRVSSLTPFAKGVAYADAPYGATRYVKLVAYDRNQNPSSASGQVAGSTVQVANGDVASLSVGKLTAGTMSADVVVAGRFATALTGARREMNAVGFQGWDASNNLTISLDGSNNLLTGVLQTALSGRRIRVGAAGNVGQIDFIAPDGTSGLLRTYTESGGIEAMQFGIPLTGKHALWNRINFNNDNGGWANYRANKQEMIYGKTTGYWRALESANDGAVTDTYTTRLYADTTQVFARTAAFRVYEEDGTARFQIGTSGMSYWDPGGVNRLFLSSTGLSYFSPFGEGLFTIAVDGKATHFMDSPFSATNGVAEFKPATVQFASPILTFVNEASTGAGLNFYGSTFNTIQVLNVFGSAFNSITASAFNIGSDDSIKANLRDADDDFMALLEPIKPKRYRRKLRDKDDEEILGNEEIGFSANELPMQLRGVGSQFGETADLYQLVTAAIGALRQLAARVDKLDGKGKK